MYAIIGDPEPYAVVRLSEPGEAFDGWTVEEIDGPPGPEEDLPFGYMEEAYWARHGQEIAACQRARGELEDQVFELEQKLKEAQRIQWLLVMSAGGKITVGLRHINDVIAPGNEIVIENNFGGQEVVFKASRAAS